MMKGVCASFGIAVRHRPINKIRTLVRSAKDHLPKERSRDNVYAIPCQNCPTAYIGETGRQQKTRNSGHVYSIKKASQTGVFETGLAAHAHHQNHTFDFEGTKRLEKEPRLPLRKIKERLQQHQRNNCCLNEEQKYIHKAWLQVGDFLHSKQAAKAKLTQH